MPEPSFGPDGPLKSDYFKIIFRRGWYKSYAVTKIILILADKQPGELTEFFARLLHAVQRRSVL